jgi:hypothetical protein
MVNGEVVECRVVKTDAVMRGEGDGEIRAEWRGKER